MNIDNLYVLIENLKGSKHLYKYKEEIDKLILVKKIKEPFPAAYGHIPRTHIDAEALDVVVLSSEPLERGTLVSIRILGAMRLEGKITDYIIISVVNDDLKNIEDINDLSQKEFNDIKNFFETFKNLKYKKCFNVREAKKIIKNSMELYERVV
ncbi:MAG: inorganic diphosphatase [Candidatus Aenigmarchaeota archaeon]|nr:inorganic diphosphatase [Candidatus Aenigmarchaeota archaeon]